jgi:hypothetical protein
MIKNGAIETMHDDERGTVYVRASLRAFDTTVFLLERMLRWKVDVVRRFLRQSLLATPLGAITFKAPWLRSRGLVFLPLAGTVAV